MNLKKYAIKITPNSYRVVIFQIARCGCYFARVGDKFKTSQSTTALEIHRRRNLYYSQVRLRCTLLTVIIVLTRALHGANKKQREPRRAKSGNDERTRWEKDEGKARVKEREREKERFEPISCFTTSN